MKLSLTQAGLLDPGTLAAWTSERKRAIRTAVAQGLKTGGVEVRDAARTRMRAAFKVARSGFVNSMQAKVLDKKPERLPNLLIGSRIPWLGLHEAGGTVSGNMLIPLLPNRMGPKQFAKLVDALMRSGNAFFIKKGGKVILMAENIQENSRQLSRFKKAERGRTGTKKIKRGQEVPIAVLVKRVNLKRRLGLVDAVQSSLPGLAQAIENALEKT
jgi:hypothetical protein